MFLGLDARLFFDNVITFYQSLPNEGKLITVIILILIFITSILLIIMLEQKRLNKKIATKKVEVSEDTEVLNFDLEEIDETNEKTRNLKEITDKIQAVIDGRTIDLTRFEQDQEENSVISYDELMKSVGKNVETPKQDFSLPNLVNKIEVDEEIEKEQPFVIPPKNEETRDGKFQSSVFISPVFGVQDTNGPYKKEEAVPIKEKEPIKQESVKEEELFLTNLINFRKNLE